MGTLKFLGGDAAVPTAVSTRSYIQSLLAGNLSQSEVNDIIAARLSEYATKAYTDSQDGQLADSAYIDAADASRLSKSNLNVPGYPFTLDGNGKIPASRIKVSGMQGYPGTTVTAVGGSGATTTSSTAIQTISVADPGQPYRILVFGSVHGGVATDNGAMPQVEVLRGNTRVGIGWGPAESYRMPTDGAVGSRMYASAFTPVNYTESTVGSLWPNRRTTGWTLLGWNPVSSSDYTTTLSGTGNMRIGATMKGVTITAQMAFAGGAIPNGPGGKLKVEAQLVLTRVSGATGEEVLQSGVIENQSSSQFNFSVLNVDVAEADMLTIKVKQSLEAPLGFGFDNGGGFATWAPTITGATNTVTVTPALAPTPSSGEIVVLPVAHSAFTGASTLSVYLGSVGGASVTAYPSPTARITAIPIPA